MISKLATPYKFENWGAVRWNARTSKVTTIIVHHMASTNFNIVPDVWKDRSASAHYGIGKNGEIHAYVDESKAAWHSSGENQYSIGIECCNISGAPDWKISDATFDALAKLCIDINNRYGGALKIIGHRDVGSTECPGDYLYSRLDELRSKVNGKDDTAEYKAIIKNKVGLSNPTELFAHIDKYKYAKDLYRKWAESYR